MTNAMETIEVSSMPDRQTNANHLLQQREQLTQRIQQAVSEMDHNAVHSLQEELRSVMMHFPDIGF